MSECYDYRHMRDRETHCHHRVNSDGRYMCCWCAQIAYNPDTLEHGPAMENIIDALNGSGQTPKADRE